MQQLIKISESNGQQTVSARELHTFFEVTERFSSWFERQLQYGFIENVDFVGCKVFNTLANQELQDFALTLDCAKEISMLQRSEKGAQARRYFIACEKRLKETVAIAAIDFTNPNTILQLAQNWADEQNKRLQVEKQLEAQKPLIVFAEALQISDHDILIGELAKILKQNNIEIGQNRLFEWLRNNGYLMRQGEQYNLPTQRAMEQELFEVKTTTINNADGSVRVTKTTKVTPKGQKYFINRFLNAAACAV